MNWDTQTRGQNREDRFTTSYGDDNMDGDYDGKSCADYDQLAGRGMRGVEDMTMLQGLADKAHEDESN